MPTHVRTIELYTCDFKCGHKAAEEYKILNHEEKCYCNPLNKACRICVNCGFEKGFLVCKEKGLYFKVSKRKETDADKKVYDKDMNVLWEIKPFPENWQENYEECEKIEKHNANRPFPTKVCESFKLGKKIF